MYCGNNVHYHSILKNFFKGLSYARFKIKDKNLQLLLVVKTWVI